MDYNNAEQVALYHENGDLALRNEIVLKNMGLVRTVAMSMRNLYLKFGDVDDIVNEGVLALLDAIENYDPSKGTKFETFANLKIRGAIIDYLRKHDWAPRGTRKFAYTLNEAIDMLCNKIGRMPTTEELAKYLKMDESKLLKLMADCAGLTTISLEELLSETYIDEPTVNPQIEEGLIHNELMKALTKAIKGLKGKYRQVIILYYYKDMNYLDIAKILGVTEGRVSQIHSKAILELKTELAPYFIESDT